MHTVCSSVLAMYIVQSMECISVTAIHARKSQIYKCITWAADINVYICVALFNYNGVQRGTILWLR